MGELLMLNVAFQPDLAPTNPVPPGAISASMKNSPFSWQTHLAHLTKERNSLPSVAIKTNLNFKTSRNFHQALSF